MTYVASQQSLKNWVSKSLHWEGPLLYVALSSYNSIGTTGKIELEFLSKEKL